MIILDFIAVAVLLIGFIIGYKRGLINSIYSIVSLVATIIIVMLLQEHIVASMSAGSFAKGIYSQIQGYVDSFLAQPQSQIDAALNTLPSFMGDYIPDTTSATQVMSANIASYATTIFLKTIVSSVLFIVIKLAFALLYPLIQMIFKLPVIKNANSIGGGLLGIVNVLAVMYVICGIAAVFLADNSRVLENTYLVQFLYHNNIVMQLLT